MNVHPRPLFSISSGCLFSACNALFPAFSAPPCSPCFGVPHHCCQPQADSQNDHNNAIERQILMGALVVIVDVSGAGLQPQNPGSIKTKCSVHTRP